MSYPFLLPALRDILQSIRKKDAIEQVVDLILEKAVHLAGAVHGSFVLVDHEARRLTISNVYGSDWTLREKLCQLPIGQGLTGKVAASGQPLLSADTSIDPDYYPLFPYVRSELVVPVVVKDRVWGVINIDGSVPGAFDTGTLDLLVVFAELAASAIMLRLEMSDQDRLYRKLIQTEKLASLGEALAGIAHEINNPLTSILCYSSLLTQQANVDAETRRTLGVIASESKRASTLIRSVLGFSHKGTGRRDHLDINGLVQEVISLQRCQPRFAHVKVQAAVSITPIFVDVCPHQIKQVLHNLLTNAAQAMPAPPHAGTIAIGLERQGKSVLLSVSDNGRGIPPELHGNIFDPFFTTKAPGEGTGLGLSICHTIMEAHDGSIQLAASSPAGTTFLLKLPLSAASARPGARPATDHAPEIDAGGKVLIVDDERNIAESLSAFLRARGLVVREAADSDDAKRLLREELFDLVISDVAMPGSDGLQLYQEALRISPAYERRFVFMSGDRMRGNVKAHLAATNLPCLEKPFSLDELLRTLARMLPARRLSLVAA